MKPGSPARRTIGCASRPERAELAAVASARSASTSASAASSIAGAVLTAQEVEPGGAEVHAGDRPVVEAGDPERAAVAHALAQDPQREREVAAVLPDRLGDAAVVVRLLLADAVRLPADPEVASQPAAAVNELPPVTPRASPHHASRSMRSAWVYTLKRVPRRKPTTVWPKRSAAATARLDGADTAHSTATPATAAFCTSSNDSRPETSTIWSLSGSAPSSSAWPISLSSALCRPTSSRGDAARPRR